jgi:hypothetical protein
MVTALRIQRERKTEVVQCVYEGPVCHASVQSPPLVIAFPSPERHLQQVALDDLIFLRLQFFYIPIRPNHLSLQEIGLRAREPNLKVGRQIFYYRFKFRVWKKEGLGTHHRPVQGTRLLCSLRIR